VKTTQSVNAVLLSLIKKIKMYSFTDVNNIFESSNNLTVYQHDDDQYVAENVLHIPTAKMYEEEGGDISEILSFGSSPIATDVQTGNGILSLESSERRDNGLRSIYEIRILHMHNALIHVGYQHH
jgi:hypothetical protein